MTIQFFTFFSLLFSELKQNFLASLIMKIGLCAKAVLLLIVPLNLLAFDADTTATITNADTIKKWSYKSLSLVSVAQNAFVNWSAGGESSLTGKAAIDYDIKYKKNRFIFNHSANLVFGLVGYIDKRVEKTNDKLNLAMSFSHKTSKNWSLANLITLKTQFANGYKYPDDSTLISTFFAPAYLIISVGFNYSPNDKFQLFWSPVSGKVTFVMNDALANRGSYGVKKAVVDSLGNIIAPGKHFLGEVGFNLVTSYKAELMKNIKLNTALTFHNNYLDFDIANRWNIDVDFDTRVVFSINHTFATILYVHLKYDHNAKFPNYETVGGEEVQVSESPKLQINESFGLGVTYQIN